jgi:phage virion morphogenesis protein
VSVGIAYAINSPDIAAANARLAELAAKYDDLTPIMVAAAAIAAQASERAFQEERSPGGQQWPPLATATQRAFVARGVRRGAHPILQVTGQLAASLSSMVTPQSMVFGTNMIQAAVQQFGESDRNIPSRAFVGLSDDDLSAIEQAAVAFLAG